MINRLLRPGGPPIHTTLPDFTSNAFTAVKSRVIMKKLDQLIPMHFPNEVPLEDVLKHIRQATADDNFPGIPIYVDPVGLQNAEKTMASTVLNLDFDAIPVKDGLRLCLKQLDLAFCVRDGFVMISDGDSATIPVYEDPVQVCWAQFAGPLRGRNWRGRSPLRFRPHGAGLGGHIARPPETAGLRMMQRSSP